MQSIKLDFQLCHWKLLIKINTSNVYMQNGLLLVIFSFGSIELKQRGSLACGRKLLWHKDIIEQNEYSIHYFGKSFQKIFFFFWFC